VDAGDLQPRIGAHQVRRRAFGHAGPAAEQEDLEAALRRHLAQPGHEVGAGDAALHRRAEERCRPHHRHPVGHHEVGARVRSAQAGVMLQVDDLVGVRGDDQRRGATRGERHHLLDHFLETVAVDPCVAKCKPFARVHFASSNADAAMLGLPRPRVPPAQ